MWPFPLVNVTQTIGGLGKQDRTLCTSEKLWEMRRKCQYCFSFSSIGIYHQPKYALAQAQRRYFNSLLMYMCAQGDTQPHTPPPFLHILRGEVRLSAVWGSRTVFPLSWHPAHVNRPALQKPLMQGPVLTVFWQWVTICQPWPLSDCRSLWKTDLWWEQRLI